MRTSWVEGLQRMLPRTPLQNACTALAGAVLWVAVRMVARGGFGSFVVAGDVYTSADRLRAPIPVLHGSGYDGQFFYRLAGAPFRWGLAEVDGVRFDNGFRSGRIGYPALAWVVSLGGRPSLVPFALVAVNVVAIGVLGYLGARLAVQSGRAPAWGLLVAGYFGYSFSLGRDLSEIVAAAAICAALVALRDRRHVVASAALVLAVLTREQAVLSVAALAVGVFIGERRAGGGPGGLRAASWLAVPPAAVFIAWQALVGSATGEWPALASSGAHGDAPAAGVFGKLPDWFREAFGPEWHRFAFLLFLALVLLVVGAASSGGLRAIWGRHPWELLLGVMAMIVTIRFYGLTVDPAHFRQAYELAIVCWLVMWAGRPRSTWLVAAYVVPLTLAATGYRALIV